VQIQQPTKPSKMRASAKSPTASALWACTATLLLHTRPFVALETTLNLNNGSLAVTNELGNSVTSPSTYNDNANAKPSGDSVALPSTPSDTSGGQPSSDSLAFAYAPSGSSDGNFGGSNLFKTSLS